MKKIFLWLVLLQCTITAGCSTSTHYYVLHTLEVPAGETVNSHNITVGLEAIDLPAYIDQTRMIRRTGRNTLAVAENAKWSEPLEAGVQRIITANLAGLWPGAQVEQMPWPRGLKPDFRLRVNVVNFDSNSNGSVLLSGSWSIEKSKNHQAPIRYTYHFDVPSQGQAYADIAATMSEALAELTRHIALTVSRYEESQPSDSIPR